MKAELEKATHTAHGVYEYFFRIEEILVRISCTNVAILKFDLILIHLEVDIEDRSYTS